MYVMIAASIVMDAANMKNLIALLNKALSIMFGIVDVTIWNHTPFLNIHDCFNRLDYWNFAIIFYTDTLYDTRTSYISFPFSFFPLFYVSFINIFRSVIAIDRYYLFMYLIN